jgi:hypothetical protein
MDFEIAAVDIFNEGMLMAPVSAIPRVLARQGLKFDDISLWEIHEAFSAQVLCHIKALEDKNFIREKAGVEHIFGSFPRDRMNPNGGSVALGHPFAATGARILPAHCEEIGAEYLLGFPPTPKPELKRVHRFRHGAGRIPGTFVEGASLYFIKEWAPSGAHGLIDECHQCLAIAPEFVPKPRCKNEAVGPAPDDDDVVRFIWTIHR